MSNFFSDFTYDLRYAGRMLRSAPMFTIVVVGMLALGIGANTSIFSVMNAVMLRSLPVPNPQQLVHLRTTGNPSGTGNTGDTNSSFSMYVFEQLRTEREVFSDLLAFVPLSFTGRAAVRYGREPEEADAHMVSGNFFSGLGVGTVCGRTLTLEDEKTHAQVAVLGHGYWSRRFGQSCSVLGQTIHVLGVPFTIVGVAAKGFSNIGSARPTDIWVPLQDRLDMNAWGVKREKSFYAMRDWWCLLMIGRLMPEMTEKEAQARLTPAFQRAAYAHLSAPKRDEKPPNLYFEPARGIAGWKEARTQLGTLFAMVGLVLLIACSNVAMMIAARNAARLREFSIRMAVGGGRTRLFRQLLTESLALVALGTGLGWLFAIGATRVLGVWSGIDVSLEPDRTVLLFTLAISMVVALIFGLVPLRGVLRVPIGFALKASGAAATSDRNRSLGRKLVIAGQVSLCLMLLIGAGLLVRTLRNLQQVNLGVRTSGLLVFGISPQRSGDNTQTIRFHEALLDRLNALPGVEAVTLMENRIGSGWSNNTNAVVDGKRPEGDKYSPMRWNSVGPDYFRTLGTPILYGRDFNRADSATAPRVAIINQMFAKRYLVDRSPLGHQVGLPGAPPFAIVGVVANSKYTTVREPDMPMVYFPYQQAVNTTTLHYALQTSGNPANLLPAVRQAVREFAPDVPLLEAKTLQQQFEQTITGERLIARLATCFGLLAVLLVATGVYGALAYAVSRRTAEVGIRMALGAQRGQVLWMVLRESLIVCLAGIAVGLPLAIACSRLLRAMLFGVTPEDPLTFVLSLAGITAVALLASLLPALRAASVNPIVALRQE